MIRRNNKNFLTGNDNAHGVAWRTASALRRVHSCPLPLAMGVLTDTQKELVHEVIARAEAADLAEVTRARRRPCGEFNACWVPEFGSNMSDYLPTQETRELRAFIDGLCREERSMLLAVKLAGRDRTRLTTSSIQWLLSIAAANSDHAGSYMTSKTHLVRYLRDGLRKFESFSAGKSRRWQS